MSWDPNEDYLRDEEELIDPLEWLYDDTDEE